MDAIPRAPPRAESSRRNFARVTITRRDATPWPSETKEFEPAVTARYGYAIITKRDAQNSAASFLVKIKKKKKRGEKRTRHEVGRPDTHERVVDNYPSLYRV